MAALFWSALAIADREEIYAFIAVDDTNAAARVDIRIERAVERLRDFPESGRPGRVEGTRELTVAGLRYVIPYRVDGDRVRILRVLHGAQQWPQRFAP